MYGIEFYVFIFQAFFFSFLPLNENNHAWSFRIEWFNLKIFQDFM